MGTLPPVSSLFATVLGVNPVEHLLAADGRRRRSIGPCSPAATSSRTCWPGRSITG
ncbi:hypothetical protein FRACA_1370016 [Frankia canadensis]|uniref:Uncharacterized protein n=1 Tax=Frankia canadensis TaxID=1836972 RepID=A0A2I2KL44_9ACTN|nr:hypothetical protein FRACA_1370016 [Frankia canadensis]SOU53647.1 hypothetical protein FRACA_1370016 [Frankia canadensis]